MDKKGNAIRPKSQSFWVYIAQLLSNDKLKHKLITFMGDHG